MIIKEKDSLDPALQELEAILQLPSLTNDLQAKGKREIKFIRSGARGENDSAYFIDFHYKDSRNWAVIHDLRIEHDGYVAQIDHLLINRFLEFFVLESKNYAVGLKITDRGEFMAVYSGHYVPVESPIEQNKRHVLAVEKLIKDQNIMPKRMGLKLSPTFRPYVLVSPKSRVINGGKPPAVPGRRAGFDKSGSL